MATCWSYFVTEPEEISIKAFAAFIRKKVISGVYFYCFTL